MASSTVSATKTTCNIRLTYQIILRHYLEPVERAVVLDHEVLGIADWEEIAVLTQLVGDVQSLCKRTGVRLICVDAGEWKEILSDLHRYWSKSPYDCYGQGWVRIATFLHLTRSRSNHKQNHPQGGTSLLIRFANVDVSTCVSVPKYETVLLTAVKTRVSS